MFIVHLFWKGLAEVRIKEILMSFRGNILLSSAVRPILAECTRLFTSQFKKSNELHTPS